MIRAREENKELKEKLNTLILQQQNYEEILLENQRLKAILDYKQDAGYDFISAGIIGQTPSVEYDGLIIDKGRKQGVGRDMPVIAYQGHNLGVVGRITEIDINTARVLLVNDMTCEISAMVRRSREQGVVMGSEKTDLKMKYLLPEADTREGDVIITSGLGGIFPKGMCLGRVKQVIKKEYALYKEALIIPEVNIKKIEEVLIIRSRE